MYPTNKARQLVDAVIMASEVDYNNEITVKICRNNLLTYIAELESKAYENDQSTDAKED